MKLDTLTVEQLKKSYTEGEILHMCVKYLENKAYRKARAQRINAIAKLVKEQHPELLEEV